MRILALRHCNSIAYLFLGLVVAVLGLLQGYLTHRHGIDVPGHGRVLHGGTDYAMVADQLIEAGSFTLDGTQRDLSRMPLYVVFVVVAKLIAGPFWSYFLIAMQGTLAILCGILINRTVRRLTTSPLIPCLVTVTYALHVTLQVEHLALRESGLYEFLIISFFYLATQRPTPRIFVMMTAICVAAYYTRATGALLTVALVLFIAFQAEYSTRRRMTLLALSLGTVILAATPWLIFQSAVQGRFTIASTGVGGLVEYKGNSLAFEAINPYVDHDAGERFFDQLIKLHPELPQSSGAMRGVDNAKALSIIVKKEIQSDYPRFFRMAVLRVTAYLSPLFTPLGTGDVHLQGERLVIDDFQGNFVKASKNWLAFAKELSFFVVLFAIPLGLLGNLQHVIFPNPMRVFAVASLGFLLANIGSHALIIAETRYRIYLDPLFVIWAWIAAACIFRPLPLLAPVLNHPSKTDELSGAASREAG